MRPKIAIIGANYQYLPFYRQTKALGYEIFSFARAMDDHPCWDLSDHYYDLAFKDKEKILEVCKENGVQGVTSFLLESALPVVYYVAEGLGSPCNSKECQSLRRFCFPRSTATDHAEQNIFYSLLPFTSSFAAAAFSFNSS